MIPPDLLAEIAHAWAELLVQFFRFLFPARNSGAGLSGAEPHSHQ